jgi:hypothetical protein
VGVTAGSREVPGRKPVTTTTTTITIIINSPKFKIRENENRTCVLRGAVILEDRNMMN